jgi:hypothetical protein
MSPVHGVTYVSGRTKCLGLTAQAFWFTVRDRVTDVIISL